MGKCKIVRMFTHKEVDRDGHVVFSKRTIRKNLTLEEAQAHCKDPETSMKTCTKDPHAGRYEDWFDGYAGQR